MRELWERIVDRLILAVTLSAAYATGWGLMHGTWDWPF